jgi:hypothetical protein
MMDQPRRRRTAILLAVPIAVVLAASIAVAGLAGFGPESAPGVPAPPVQAVGKASPKLFDHGPGTVEATTGDSVAVESATREPGTAETAPGTVSAGGAAGGVVLRTGGLNGGVVLNAGGLAGGIEP